MEQFVFKTLVDNPARNIPAEFQQIWKVILGHNVQSSCWYMQARQITEGIQNAQVSQKVVKQIINITLLWKGHSQISRYNPFFSHWTKLIVKENNIYFEITFLCKEKDINSVSSTWILFVWSNYSRSIQWLSIKSLLVRTTSYHITNQWRILP